MCLLKHCRFLPPHLRPYLLLLYRCQCLLADDGGKGQGFGLQALGIPQGIRLCVSRSQGPASAGPGLRYSQSFGQGQTQTFGAVLKGVGVGRGLALTQMPVIDDFPLVTPIL